MAPSMAAKNPWTCGLRITGCVATLLAVLTLVTACESVHFSNVNVSIQVGFSDLMCYIMYTVSKRYNRGNCKEIKEGKSIASQKIEIGQTSVERPQLIAFVTTEVEEMDDKNVDSATYFKQFSCLVSYLPGNEWKFSCVVESILDQQSWSLGYTKHTESKRTTYTSTGNKKSEAQF
ncbi:hypothetical protein CFP56_007629 [Quercus suber]|uniref:Uncharacterized protein n=1 Tax=Quercus suber TaxID=58331 RepID=A0AAW0L8E0_QUESU